MAWFILHVIKSSPRRRRSWVPSGWGRSTLHTSQPSTPLPAAHPSPSSVASACSLLEEEGHGWTQFLSVQNSRFQCRRLLNVLKILKKGKAPSFSIVAASSLKSIWVPTRRKGVFWQWCVISGTHLKIWGEKLLKWEGGDGQWNWDFYLLCVIVRAYLSSPRSNYESDDNGSKGKQNWWKIWRR